MFDGFVDLVEVDVSEVGCVDGEFFKIWNGKCWEWMFDDMVCWVEKVFVVEVFFDIKFGNDVDVFGDFWLYFGRRFLWYNKELMCYLSIRC